MGDQETKQEIRDRMERERQARVHQEAHEPTADWIDLADDPDEDTAHRGLVPQAAIDAGTEALVHAAFDPPLDKARRVIEAALPYLAERPDEAFRRGVAIGKAEGEVQAIDGQLVTAEPGDYDIWRDALLIASPIFAGGGDAEAVLNVARNVIRPSLLNCGGIGAESVCPHCGCDPSTPIPETHDAGCPNEPNGE